MEPAQPPIPIPPVPVLGYMTPAALSGEVAWRDRMFLVAADKSTLPPRCVRCNQPSRRMLYKRFVWQSPWWALAIFAPCAVSPFALKWGPAVFGIMIILLIILSIIFTLRVRIHYGLCHEHLRRRDRRMGIFVLLLLTFLASMAAWVMRQTNPAFLSSVFARNSDSFAIIVILVSVTSAVAAIIWKQFAIDVLRAKRIANKRAWLRGAGIEFLNSLPPI